MLGASMVKYTTPLPYICLSECDSKMYIIFESCEEKNHKHLRNTLIYKAKQFMFLKLNTFSKKCLHILGDSASSV